MYYTIGGVLYHHGIQGQKWGKRNGPPYPLKPSDHSAAEKKVAKKSTKQGKEISELKKDSFDPFKAMEKIDNSLSKKEKDFLGVGNDESTDDIKFFFNKNKTAYLITADYHNKYKDEHPIPGKIIGIAAEKSARGTGDTDKLISQAKEEFKNEQLVAEIDRQNEPSRKLFERNGFKKVKTLDDVDYYVWKRGK